MPAVKRFLLPILFNLLVPGTGLVVLGRPWVGVCLAGLFLLGAELGILGLLVTPTSLPQVLSVAALGAAAGIWLAGQILLAARIRFLRGPGLPRELAILHRLAQRAISRSDFGTAQAAIGVALSMDDSDVHSHVLRARILSLTGPRAKAQRAWLLARRLDVGNQHSEEIGSHLESSPSE
jgi:hypothetical protein